MKRSSLAYFASSLLEAAPGGLARRKSTRKACRTVPIGEALSNSCAAVPSSRRERDEHTRLPAPERSLHRGVSATDARGRYAPGTHRSRQSGRTRSRRTCGGTSDEQAPSPLGLLGAQPQCSGCSIRMNAHRGPNRSA
eukprot:scaffold11721_cov63-Phaeocystis_antarctica.AAC.2